MRKFFHRHSAGGLSGRSIGCSPVENRCGMRWLPSCLFAIVLAMPPFICNASAQTQECDPALLFSVEARVLSFTRDMQSLIDDLPYSKDLTCVEESYDIQKSKWATYYSSYMVVIAESDTLLTLVGELETLTQAAGDSISVFKARSDARSAFLAAQASFPEYEKQYGEILSKAKKLSASAKLAPMLEKLKVKESMLLSQMETSYSDAKSSVELLPELRGDMQGIDETYVNLKRISSKIQEMAYKPFIQRIKDYLLGIAAVAVVIMFFNMVQSKLKAAKQAKQNLKKFKEQFMNDDDIPSI